MRIFIALFAIAFGLSFSYAVFTIVGERVAWKVADHVTEGALKVENYIVESKIRTGLMNYQTLTENLASKLQDPAYTFEQFKHDEYGKINYELQFIHIGQRILDSYKDSHD